MSSLSIDDALAYRNFLTAIPANIIVKKGPKKRTRNAQAGLDDTGSIAVPGFTLLALSASSIKKALVIVSGFYGWLVTVRYVTANPFVGVQAASGLMGVGMGSTNANDEEGMTRARARRASVLGRVLPWEATHAINRYIDHSPASQDVAFVARVRFIYKLATMTGLRISEMSAARRDDLEYIEPDPVAGTDGGWMLHVLGKRDKPREVPIPGALIAELGIYLAHRGLIILPSASLAVEKGKFLIGGFPSYMASHEEAAIVDLANLKKLTSHPLARLRKPKQVADGVRPQTLHLALKKLFKIALANGQFKDEKTAEKMRTASAHWLRLTLATRAIAAGTPVDVVAGILGHANIATTSIYVQAERHRKLTEMQKLWGGVFSAATREFPVDAGS